MAPPSPISAPASPTSASVAASAAPMSKKRQTELNLNILSPAGHRRLCRRPLRRGDPRPRRAAPVMRRSRPTSMMLRGLVLLQARPLPRTRRRIFSAVRDDRRRRMRGTASPPCRPPRAASPSDSDPDRRASQRATGRDAYRDSRAARKGAAPIIRRAMPRAALPDGGENSLVATEEQRVVAGGDTVARREDRRRSACPSGGADRCARPREWRGGNRDRP